MSRETEPLLPVLRENGLTTYPLVALGLLGIVDNFQAAAFTLLTPEISRALGLSLGAIAGARTLAFLATVVAPLPMAALSQSRGRRALLCVVTGIAWSVVTLFSGFVTSLLALLVVLVLDGLSSGSVQALHTPLLVDSYPQQARVRILSAYTAVTAAGTVISPLMVGLLAGPLDLTWRGVFIGLGLVSTATSLIALRLEDPPVGRFEETQNVEAGQPLSELRFFEIVRRVLLVPTVKRLAVGYLVVGILVIPFGTFLATFLEQRWGLGPGERALFFAGTSATSIGVLAVFGARTEQLFARDPAKIISLSGLALVVAVICIAAGAIAPVFGLMCALFALGSSFLALLTPGLTAPLLSVVDPRYRPHAAAVVGIFIAAGAILGVLFLGGLDRRFGLSGAIVALMVPGVVGGLVIGSARGLIARDLARMVAEAREADEIRTLKASGGSLPLLTCRGIDFSYGQLQVLFGVDFTVDAGEMVALLGTNGAGKSTLLKAVSGVGLPSGGTVRFEGHDITYLDAERRVGLGISQVPGGRAVFGSLDVVENLRMFGYTLGRDRKRIDASIDLCLDTFPRLREREGSLAVNLSGGEQQMLGLAKALILEPKLLLIDELSLGLAPLIVGQLLDLVRSINATGTAVVLVEQSVNIALSLVDHAYFMEKGEMRFDGPAKELLERGDLLRAVFLDGAPGAKR